MLKESIQALAQTIFFEIVDTRRHLHANPELSFQEYNTSVFVKEKLDALGIAWEEMANTGIVALIKGEQVGDGVIALRADMDALPIKEVEGRPYGSKNIGVMHACGHDVHTSSLLGTAKILASLKNQFAGTVKLIFQPG